MRVPIALHNTPSAMDLLHTIPPAYLITETGPARYVDAKIQWMDLNNEYHKTSYGHGNLCYKVRTFFFCFLCMIDWESWTKNSEARHPLREPGSASQHPECNGPAPHCHCDLFDHHEWGFQVREWLTSQTAHYTKLHLQQLWVRSLQNVLMLTKCLKWFEKRIFFFWMKAGIWNQKLGRSRMQSTPTALHSDQSAMVLLHTVPLAFVITKRDRPGEWARRSRTDE